jgi:SAM-dependent methyltransferase
MKVHDSGMPEEAYWNSLFDVPGILGWLPLSADTRLAVEIGCGSGTFTVPLAQALQGQVRAFDIDPAMLAATAMNLARAGLLNVVLAQRDVLDDGTGLPDASADLVLLFNLLHDEGRRTFLAEASRILRPGGLVAVLHWRKDIATPRGPAFESRPDPRLVAEAAAGLELVEHGAPRLLEPFHWGMLLRKADPA